MIRIVIVEDNKETQMQIKNILRETDIFKEEIKIEYFTKFTKELQNIIKDTSERKVFIVLAPHSKSIRSQSLWKK